MRALGASRTSLVPGGVLAGPWAKNDLWRRARAVPSLDLRFADNKSLVDAVTGASLVTFNRASNGTFVDSAGVLQTAATDVPRFDHNPITGESLGLLVEEQRVNSIRNNTGVGAVAGTPGTLPTNWAGTAATDLTREVVGTGTENGIAYIDLKFTGTVVASRTQFIFFEPSNNVSASNTQLWTGSAWVKIVAGSLANITSVAIQTDTRDSSLVYVSTPFVGAFTPTSAFARYSGSGTATGATIAWIQPFVRFITASSGAIDITLRIGLPQLEQGAFATSVIPTTTAAVTRSADVASITGSAFSGWYRQDEGSWLWDGRFNAVATNFGVFSVSDSAGAVSNRHSIRVGNTIITSGGTQVAEFFQTPVAQTPARYAYGYAVNNYCQVLNSVAATDLSGAMPVGVNSLEIGKVEGSSLFTNGHIRRLCYWPTRLSNSTLQAITQ